MPRLASIKHQIGVEITYHPTKKEWHRLQGLDWERREDAEQDITRAIYNSFRAHTDLGMPECEVHHAPFSNLDDLAKFWLETTRRAAKIGWKPFVPYLAGDGHLHLSPTPKYPLHAAANACPWLGWVFGDPYDDENFTVPFEYSRYERYVSVRVTSHGPRGTQELRFFDGPHTVQEQIAHALFADRWMTWAKKQPRGVWRFNSEQELKAISLKQAKAEFYDMLKTLKLPRADYEVFVRRNLNTRYRLKLRRN